MNERTEFSSILLFQLSAVTQVIDLMLIKETGWACCENRQIDISADTHTRVCAYLYVCTVWMCVCVRESECVFCGLQCSLSPHWDIS